ncbi:pre-rRNA processing protein [Sorochytrium milnesiophthora]
MRGDDFFLADGGSARGQERGKKRQRPAAAGGNGHRAGKRRNKRTDSDNSDDDDDDDIDNGEEDDGDDQVDMDDLGLDDEEEDPNESAADKRIRLAKRYLERVKHESDVKAAEGFDAADLDRDLIAERLRDDALESAGKLFRRIAAQYMASLPAQVKRFPRGHQLSVTCVAATASRQWIYTGSKDGSIIKWDAATGRKAHTFPGLRKNTPATGPPGHTQHVLCLAVSADGRYLASGGLDARLNIWSVRDDKHVHCFRGHRDSVTGVVFKNVLTGCTLYSCSKDRTVKVWSLDEMTYVETLFGHQEAVACIDALSRDRCVTAGGRDKSVRLWKIVEESQLVFRASQHMHGTLDVVHMVTDEYYVSGDDTGTLSLWTVTKKKAVFSLPHAHGLMDVTNAERDVGITQGNPYWIVSLTGPRFSDLFFSGSWNGVVKAWRLDASMRQFSCVGEITVTGVVNSMQLLDPALWPTPLAAATSTREFTASGEAEEAALDIHGGVIPTTTTSQPQHHMRLVLGVGQEHKSGRWWRVKSARNTLQLVDIPPRVIT